MSDKVVTDLCYTLKQFLNCYDGEREVPVMERWKVGPALDPEAAVAYRSVTLCRFEVPKDVVEKAQALLKEHFSAKGMGKAYLRIDGLP